MHLIYLLLRIIRTYQGLPFLRFISSFTTLITGFYVKKSRVVNQWVAAFMATRITRGQDINLTKPVFVKARHLPEEDSRYTVSEIFPACEDVAGYKSMDGSQRIGLWRLYPANREYSYCWKASTFGGCMSTCWTQTLSWSWVTMVRKSLLPAWLCQIFPCPTKMLTLRQHWKKLGCQEVSSVMSVIETVGNWQDGKQADVFCLLEYQRNPCPGR